MSVHVTRDSVCAGDDVDAPHARTFALAPELPLEQLLEAIVASGYLPQISGGMATWSITSGIPLAVIAQQWADPRLFFLTGRDMQQLDRTAGELRLHCNYHAQRDPQLVYEVLRDLRLRAE